MLVRSICLFCLVSCVFCVHSKLHLLLNAQGVLGGKGGKIPHGHKRAGVPQVDLQGLGVARLPEPFDGVAVPQEVRVHPLGDPGLLCRRPDDLPGSGPVDGEEAVVKLEALVVGIALEERRQVVRTGHHPGLLPFAKIYKTEWPFCGAHPPGRDPQRLGDSDSGLKEGVD